jgi:phosphohistidine swiveling domain-containing protein/urease gamma subunit
MWEAYASGAEDAALKTVLSDELEVDAARHHTATLLHEAMGRVSRHFGSKSVYGGSTWDEDPNTVWNCLSVLIDSDEADPSPARADRQSRLVELKRSLRKSWKWKLTRILTGQLVDMRTRMLERMADDAAELLALREQAKSALLVVGGEERRLITEAARRLAAAGQLNEQEDVYLLSASELEGALRSGETISQFVLATRRTALAEAEVGDSLPEAFEGHPGAAAPAPSADTDRLEGWAASAGAATGPAVVVSRLEEGTRLSEGDILVTRSTDPSWTGLLLKAGGIVLEEGGPLSHAAIVAREFGVPAVLNVKGATTIIADGDTITVDGTAGVVDRAEPSPEPQDPIPEPQVIDGGELGVFIPGLMGAGILISILLVLADGARKIIPSSGDRKRAEIALGVYGIVSGAAHAAGRDVSPSARPHHDLRSRWAFALLAAASIMFGVLAFRGGVDLHQSQGTLEGNGWPLASGIGLAITAFLFAMPAILVALLYNRIPGPVRRLVAATPMGRLRPPPDDYAERARRLVPALENGGS